MTICTEDQVVSCYVFNGTILPCAKAYSFKLPKQPIKVLYINYKSFKLTLILFQDEFRLYNGREVIYSYFTSYKMYDALFGSFAKEENCLILMYENHGFEVLILHRQFNPKERYGSNKISV